jgi:hypothetical protein
MEDRRPNSHTGDGNEDEIVISCKREGQHPQAGNQQGEWRQERSGFAIGKITDDGLQNRGSKVHNQQNHSDLRKA